MYMCRAHTFGLLPIYWGVISNGYWIVPYQAVNSKFHYLTKVVDSTLLFWNDRLDRGLGSVVALLTGWTT